MSNQIWSRSGMVLCLVGASALGCNDEAPGGEDVEARLASINVNPASLAEAGVELDRLSELTRGNETSPRVLEVARQLGERLETLNGRVAKIDQADGHSFSFYVAADGTTSIAEHHPPGSLAVLDTLTEGKQSTVDIFRLLAPDAEVPAALLTPPAPSGRAIEPSTLHQTGSASEAPVRVSEIGQTDIVTERRALGDATGFVKYACFWSGAVHACHTDWFGGGFAEYWYKYSKFRIRVFSGSFLTVQTKVNNAISSSRTVFVTGDVSWFTQGPQISVRDSGCPPFPFACGTHLETQVALIRHDILNAADDGFHWTFTYYN